MGDYFDRHRIEDIIELIRRASEEVGNVNTNEEVEVIQRDLRAAQEMMERGYARASITSLETPETHSEATRNLRKLADEYGIPEDRLRMTWDVYYLDRKLSIRESWEAFVNDFEHQYKKPGITKGDVVSHV